MYSGKLLMMGRGTARNMQNFLTKNKFGKLVLLLVLIKRKFEFSDTDHQIAKQNENTEHQSITL
jgi:hypothetical protein